MCPNNRTDASLGNPPALAFVVAHVVASVARADQQRPANAAEGGDGGDGGIGRDDIPGREVEGVPLDDLLGLHTSPLARTAYL